MREKWYRTDEKENAIDYLEAAASFNADNHAHKWKWLTVGLHGALYGSAVLAVVGTDSDSVRKGKKKKHLISLWEALERCQNDNYMRKYVGSKKLALSESEMSSINTLSDTFRNNFEHFGPGHWSIEVSGFPGIMRDVCRAIYFLLLESGNVMLTQRQRVRVASSLKNVIGT